MIESNNKRGEPANSERRVCPKSRQVWTPVAAPCRSRFLSRRRIVESHDRPPDLAAFRTLTIFALFLACFIPSARAQHQTASPARPMILGVAHIAFQVSDLAKAREFYGGLLGYEEPFQIRNQDGSLALT